MHDAECFGECKNGGVFGGARRRITKSVTRQIFGAAMDGDAATLIARMERRRHRSILLISININILYVVPSGIPGIDR